MTTIAYIANEFPSQLEPYVVDEVLELRRRSATVICCSGKLSSPSSLQGRDLELWHETLFFQPLSDQELARAMRRLFSNLSQLKEITVPAFQDRNTGLLRRLRTLGHTVMGAALADRLAPLAPTTSMRTTGILLLGWRWQLRHYLTSGSASRFTVQIFWSAAICSRSNFAPAASA